MQDQRYHPKGLNCGRLRLLSQPVAAALAWSCCCSAGLTGFDALVFAAAGLEVPVFARATEAAAPAAATAGLPGFIPSAALEALVFARATEAVGLLVAIAAPRGLIPSGGFEARVFALASRAVGLLVAIAGLPGVNPSGSLQALVVARATEAMGLLLAIGGLRGVPVVQTSGGCQSPVMWVYSAK